MESCEKITQQSVLILNPTYSLLCLPTIPSTSRPILTWKVPGIIQVMASLLLVGEPWALSVACADTELSQKQGSWNKQSSTGLGFY